MIIQPGDKFWKKKPHKAAPAPAPQQNEPVISDESADENESEVELDSLGLLFIQLADATSSQDNVETNQADDVEVISIPSNPKYFAMKKTRQVIRKVPFSHPEAHLDPPFLLKKT